MSEYALITNCAVFMLEAGMSEQGTDTPHITRKGQGKMGNRIGKGKIMLLLVALLLVFTSGCGRGGQTTASNEGGTNPAEKKEGVKISNEPITLKIYNANNMNLESFKKSYTDVIQAKYPHITIEVVKNEKGATIEELTAAGNIPDIILGAGANFAATLNQLDIPEDLSPYIKKYNFNVNSIAPAVVQSLKAFFNSEQLKALPAGQMDFMLLYYNKDLFDKFAVPYPKDGMTWDELYDLAKRMTRMDNGVQYRGIDFQDNSIIQYNPLSLPLVDPKTQLASVNNSQWKQWFDNMRRFHEIPGNLKVSSLSSVNPKLDDFLKERNLAMLLCMPILSRMPEAEKTGFNWDIAAMPSYKEQPGAGLQLVAPYFAISKTSKHKDQAFLALTEVITEEALINRAKDGVLTILADPKVNEHFGENNPSLKTKNINAIKKYKVANAQPYFSPYDSVVINAMINGFRDAVKNGTDTNTALRSIEEKANKDIEAMKNK